MESWKSLSAKYTTTALGCCGVPWDLPDRVEMDLIFEESEFAAWCMVHGFTPSCIAISVNDMQASKTQDGSIPKQVNLNSIFEILEKEFPINPAYHEPIWVRIWTFCHFWVFFRRVLINRSQSLTPLPKFVVYRYLMTRSSGFRDHTLRSLNALRHLMENYITSKSMKISLVTCTEASTHRC